MATEKSRKLSFAKVIVIQIQQRGSGDVAQPHPRSGTAGIHSVLVVRSIRWVRRRVSEPRTAFLMWSGRLLTPPASMSKPNLCAMRTLSGKGATASPTSSRLYRKRHALMRLSDALMETLHGDLGTEGNHVQAAARGV